MPSLLDSAATLVMDAGKPSAILRAQDIPDDYLADLREEAGCKRLRPGQQVNRVASVPVVIADRWLAEGFDIFTAPAREIVKRLKNEGLDYFVTGKV